MEKSIVAECTSCESSFNVDYVEELVSEEYPSYCPFCGEIIEEIQEQYIEDEDDDDDTKWD